MDAHNIVNLLHLFFDTVTDLMTLQNTDIRVYLDDNIHQYMIAVNSGFHVLNPLDTGRTGNRTTQVRQTIFIKTVR